MVNPTLAAVPLAEGEKRGSTFAAKENATSIADLRAIPAEKLLDESFKNGMGSVPATIDGYFLPKPPVAIFEAGEQAHVPTLVGWNSAEIPYQALLRADAPTPENYEKAVRQLYGEKAEEVLKLYPGKTGDEVLNSATALASDRFIVYSTWKWADLQSKTGTKPVYRYVFSRPKPPMTAKNANAVPGLAGGITKSNSTTPPKPAPAAQGAPHAFEIEYAMGNLRYNEVYAWTPDDHKISAVMAGYFANFIKTGNPNGSGLPNWPAIKGDKVSYINIDVNTRAEQEQNRGRYLFLDKEYMK
jgi:para-nitrobenzyl esterase